MRTAQHNLFQSSSPYLRYVLRLHIEGFYASAFNEEKPLIVVRDKLVLDANLSARQHGVKPGMTARDAGNIVPDIKVRHWKAEEHEDRQRNWLDACVKYSDIIEPEQQHTAFVDLSQHPQPTDIADRLVATVHRVSGLPIRFGAGPSKWIAALAAEHGEWERAVKNPREFLAPLPIQELNAVLPGSRDRLRFLGYRMIGDVAALDHGVLHEQFGSEALVIQQAATGTLSDPVIGRYPPNTVAARLLFPDSIESLEALDANYRVLAQKIGIHLERKGLEGSKLELSREEEESGWSKRTREFAKPMRCEQTVLTGIRAVSNEAPPESPVLGVRVRMHDLRRVKSYQPAFIGRASSDDQAVQLGRALSQLQTSFGETSILRASDMPIERRVRVLREWQSALGWR